MKLELMEWRDRHYEHVKYVRGTLEEARKVQDKLNEGYSGPRFIIRIVE